MKKPKKYNLCFTYIDYEILVTVQKHYMTATQIAKKLNRSNAVHSHVKKLKYLGLLKVKPFNYIFGKEYPHYMITEKGLFLLELMDKMIEYNL